MAGLDAAVVRREAKLVVSRAMAGFNLAAIVAVLLLMR
jgi:hypothetical protein